ncbi:MAG: Ribulose-phosphate 3-epimerase [Clostridiaceae bacterium]|jgi:ribulose-phosphate 3-epimerase|nr:Ribulose-phosphate 3-epimerase [Clostridiaceae bacterium]
MIKISPSILSADFSKLGEEITSLNNGGADLIHIDVMDGNFVPNISLGIPVIKSIRQYTKLPFDVHLMIDNPGRYIEDFAKAGADIITVHYEADKHIDRTLNYIKSLGAMAGIAINPGTPAGVLENIITTADMVLIMTVNPGFGGQKFIDYSYEKIKAVKELRNKYNKNLKIEVDGGIGEDNIKDVCEAGAEIVVAGSAVFKNHNIKENIEGLRSKL